MVNKKIKKDVLTKGKEESCNYTSHKSLGGFYFIGFIGASIYYIQQSTGFWEGVLGILKAIVWPAFLVHKLFGL